MNPTERQHQILSLLSAREMVQIEELAQQLSVSRMTVHRDLDHLEAEGRLRKVHGGAVLVPPPAAHDGCPVCHTETVSKIQMVLHFSDDTHRVTCCPHCGLLALATQGEQVVSAMVTDFLYGRMVNVRNASFLLAPDLRLCCTPTVLAFERERDAKRFQAGFGGQILSMADALRALQTEMTLTS